MNTRYRATKRHSSHFAEKVLLRLEAIKGVKEPRVLDLYHGNGRIWEEVSKRIEVDVFGIEKEESKTPFKWIRGDNEKIVDTIDLSEFNVIGFDAYTNPVGLMNKVLPRLQRETVVIYTCCFTSIPGIPKNISAFPHFRNKCKTITNKFIEDCWQEYLRKINVEKYKEIQHKEKCFSKKYGFFSYNPCK